MLSSDLSTFVLSSFLSNVNLLELACTNQSYSKHLSSVLQHRKRAFFDVLMNYFYKTNNPLGDKQFTISLRYFTRYNKQQLSLYPYYLRALFEYLPELFNYIKKESITHLDLGSITSYGGYNQNLLNVVTDSHIRSYEIINQFLSLFSQNITITHCNLGLFYGLVDKERIIDSIKHHPVLEFLNMKAYGATTNFGNPPLTLWRNNQTLYWSHFRDDA